MHGYGGRILTVDVGTGAQRIEELDQAFARMYLGGNGFAAKLCYDRIPVGIDAFDPRNLVVFCTGPVTDSPITADYIDPATGDYVSMTSGLNPIDAQVILALTTVRGSGAAVLDLGQRLGDIDKIRKTVEREIQSEVRQAFKQLLQQRDIRLKSFTFDVQRENDYVGVVIEYVNLRAGGVRAVGLVIQN